MSGDDPIAVCRGLSKTLVLPGGGQLEVLRDVDLAVQPGESVAIQGRSGSGKSTLLALLGLLDEPTAGEYWLAGQSVGGLRDRQLSALRGRAIGFVFQRFFLMEHLSAEANVRMALVHGGYGLRRAHELVSEVLTGVGLADRAKHLPRQMSGGEQQRVAIARALIGRPRLILADEPTGALDEATSEGIVETLVSIVREQGASMVMVTHDPVVASHCDRVLHLHEGRLGVGR